MSQSRKCIAAPQSGHVVLNGENAPRNRSSVVKTTEDSKSQPVHPKERRKSKSNNKIPKSIRYDLESALVGLCDAWFEDIKPHLVRNNIKLHVHNTKPGPDVACASGDFEQRTSDAAACTHVDPASTAQNCILCGLLCNAANSIGSALFQAAGVDHTPESNAHFKPVLATPSPPGKHIRCVKTTSENFRQNSEILFRRKSKSQSQRVSRMCQTCVIPAAIIEPTSPIKDIYIRSLFKSIFNKVPICPASSPVAALPKFNEQLVSVASNTDPPSAHMHYRSRTTSSTIMPNLSRHKSGRDPPVLFPNDLIDIIGKRNDTILKNMSESHKKVEYPSVIELVSPRDHKKAGGTKKNPPWR